MSNLNYHHGDLHNALLKAAEVELRRHGFEKFSLRGVARAAGVSHAAPAHHFSDMRGLLTALATLGFERFLKLQEKAQAKSANNVDEQFVSSGVAYIRFSQNHPQLFHLMFNSQKPDRSNEKLNRAAESAFMNLVMLVNRVQGNSDEHSMICVHEVYTVWSLVHGMSGLMGAGMLKNMGTNKQQRETVIRTILQRNIPSK